MPALDINLIEQLGKDLHPTDTGVMNEGEVCPWTLFLAMSLTLLKGVLPYVPRILPAVISDPNLRQRAEETFQSQEFKDNIETYFVHNIKDEIQAPLNRQIIKSSDTIMGLIKMAENLFEAFTQPQEDSLDGNNLGAVKDHPRAVQDLSYGTGLIKLFNFAKTLYSFTKK